MKFVRVMGYYKGEFTTTEDCYLGEDIEKAEARFRKDYPAFNGEDTELKSQIIDNEDDRWKDYFRVLRMCGWSIWS